MSLTPLTCLMRRLPMLAVGVWLSTTTLANAQSDATPADAKQIDVQPPQPQPQQQRSVNQRIDINTANEDELCKLPGIGPKKAAAIIALRQKKPFTRVTQLLQVKGIGKKTLEKIRPLVVDPTIAHSSAADAEEKRLNN
jgi:competence ComEA-like helix-hairpin-helix protein